MSLVQESNVEPKTIKKSSHIIAFSSCIAVACSSMLMNTGCGTEHVASSQVSLEIRFQDDTAPTPQSSAGQLRIALAAPGPTTHDTVARILVDVTIVDSGLPFFTNFDLTKIAPDVWRGDVPLLPRDQQLRFAARALDANGDVGFSGETVATLTVDNQDVQIPLAPAQNGQTFQMPRLFRIAYPGQIQAGAEEQIAFTILDNAGASVAVQITPLGNPMTPSADFSPATGTVTLTNTVADFMTVYTAPEVTTDTDFDYQVTITDARTQSAVAITTNFSTHIIPRPPGTPIVHNLHPSVLFNPVILSLTANGSDTPGTVELVANVSDDSTPDHLTVQWNFAPNAGTPDATFANGGLGNPGLFQGYTLAHQGTITLAVTDENNGTTTLHYTLTPNQFADAIDHVSVNGLKRIVAGDAHTCVLTGQNLVRCWGDNQFGQLGYGNAIDVGDAPTRLPFTAGDVPLSAVDPITHLPFDPVQQLVAGNNHTCVLLESGLVTCWGDNRFGQLGYNRTDNLGDGEPVTSFGYVTLGDLATRIAAGGDHTCAILQDGALRCWGRNDFGQLGRGNTDNIGDNETVFSVGNVDLGAGVTVKDLALGGFHTCALLTTGAVRCWGRNDVGQLGYGNTNNLGDDEPINNLPNVSLTGTVRKLVAGAFHTCALTFAGTLRCWGDGRFGQLGQSFGGSDAFWGNQANELPSTLPSDINTGAQVIDVTAGDFHTCALSSDGQLKCWGLGSSGQLGYGDFKNLGSPPTAGVDLAGVTAYRISAGAAHTCALRSNGTARCWGQGADGRLGRGDTATSATATGNADIQIFAPRYTIGGTVSGLGGNGLVLRDNGGDDLPVNADGTFTFATSIPDLTTYAVTVQTQPTSPSQTCTVRNGSGNLAGANVTNVAITCVTNRFTVGGTVSGLTGAGLVLQDNSGDNLAISRNGTFAFATPVASGATFAVTVLTQPSQPPQTCTVSGGTGTVGSSNISNVQITCTVNTFTIGGTVSGLAAGDSITLRDNGGDDLVQSANGSFTFATPVASGRPYAVTIVANPASPISQTCTVTNGAGTVDGSNVTNVAVTCTTNVFTIGGTISGLAAGDSITLRDNGGDDLVRSANGSFTFPTPVASEQPYAVTVVANPTSPISQTCTATSGAGTVGNSNITNIAVACTTNVFTIGGTVSGLAAGDSITLRDNGGDDLVRSTNGSFAFATPVASGQPYAVTIVANPASPVSQTCTVANGAGTVGNGNVTNVAITCTTNAFTVGGTISGLAAGDSITLRDTGGDDLVRSANGSFTFATPVASGQPYAVTIVANPTSPISQTCTVASGAGTIGSGNITNVAVTCTTNVFTIGGTVSGLAAGDSITLRDNGGDDLVRPANGSFTFATPVASGQPYAVTIVANPTSPISQACTVTNGSGTVSGGSITNVAVTCTTSAFTVGGTVSGLAAGNSITLRNNSGDDLVRSANGSFTFATPVASGQPYAVTVVSPTAPVSQTCTVANGSSTVTASAITNVAVTCATSTLSITYLIVAGGGGGAGFVGGGGGGGGVINGIETVVTGTYPITVGSGGAGGSAIRGNGGQGGSSSFNGHTAIGGGGGAAVDSALDAGVGGSGGGGSYRKSGSQIGQAGAGTSGQGNAGGNPPLNSGWAGGGGGPSGPGGSGSPTRSGDGGEGAISSISGSFKVYGAGGGGAAQSGFTSAGGNGGTNAGSGAVGAGAAAVANFGGGGGGGGFDGTGHPGGAGGSGVVIIRYPGPPIASGGTITSSGGVTIHTFTATATFVVP